MSYMVKYRAASWSFLNFTALYFTMFDIVHMIPDEYCLDLVFTSLRSLLSSLFDIRCRLFLAFSNKFCRFYPSRHHEKAMFWWNRPDSQLFLQPRWSAFTAEKNIGDPARYKNKLRILMFISEKTSSKKKWKVWNSKLFDKLNAE